MSLSSIGERSGKVVFVDDGVRRREKVIDRASVSERILDIGGGGGEMTERYCADLLSLNRVTLRGVYRRCNLAELSGTIPPVRTMFGSQEAETGIPNP